MFIHLFDLVKHIEDGIKKTQEEIRNLRGNRQTTNYGESQILGTYQ